MEHLLRVLSSILVPLFFIGVAGSMLVVVLTVVLDLQQIFTRDEDGEL